MKRSLLLLLMAILTACTAPTPGVPLVSNPFPQSNTNDAALVQNFQDLAVDERLLSYQLVSVQKGILQPGQKYQIAFVAPPGKKLILVSACGLGCTSMELELKNESGTSLGNTSSSRDKVYVALNIGTSAVSLVSHVGLKNCDTRTCAVYWALYAK